MIQAMSTGITGMNAFKSELDVIGNNVANVNTTAYKSGQASFQEMLSQTISGASAPTATDGGTNATQIGLGVKIGAINEDMTQGSMQSTGRQSDLAIDGNGYFMLGSGSGVVYSRDGSFGLDSQNNIVSTSTGMKVLGWSVDPTTGAINTSAPVTAASALNVPIGSASSARATSSAQIEGNLSPLTKVSVQSSLAQLAGNLDSSASSGTVVNAPSLTVYDSLGNAHTASLSFTKTSTLSPTDATEWTYSLTVPDVQSGALQSGTVTFDGSGNSKLSTVSAPLTLSSSTGAVNPIAFSLDFSGMTETSSSSAVTSTVDGSGTAPYTMTFDIFDSLGVTHQMEMNLTKTQTLSPTNATEWTYAIYCGDASSTTPVSTGTMTFDSSGKSQLSSIPVSLTLAKPNGSVSPLAFKLDTSSISQLNGSDTAEMSYQDGLPLGTLESFSIDKSGIISGTFTNGSTQNLGQVALAEFNNPSGLMKAGNDTLVASPNSGTAMIGQPGQSGRGGISAGYLEASNVDLTKEFANMIVAERGFQANSKVITTSDSVLQTLVQLKQ